MNSGGGLAFQPHVNTQRKHLAEAVIKGQFAGSHFPELAFEGFAHHGLAQGGKIGLSLHEDELIPDALEILATAKEKGVNVSLSVETVAGQAFDNDTPQRIFPTNDIAPDWEGMDAAPASLENWKKIILSSKTILWNGPVGVFELPNFAKGTLQIAEDLAEATKKGAYTLVGGGDSVAAVTQMGYADKVSYVSTGGGAMLEAIEGKVLPGVAAIQE